MFICKDCYMENSTDSFWWEIAPKSRGGCEVCEKGDVCADIHHNRVPEKKNTDNQKPEPNEQH